MSFDFIFATENYPFALALGLMFAFAALEGVALLIGLSVSSGIDDLFPDLDVDLDIDADVPDVEFGPIAAFFGWLHFGRTPALVLIIIMLTSFGLYGFTLQSTIHSIFGSYAPLIISVIVSIILALFTTRFIGAALGRYMPKDETSAVTTDSLVGKIGTILGHQARENLSAQTRVYDDFNAPHLIFVEPVDKNETFNKGDQVYLVSKKDRLFYAVKTEKSSN